jgi:hypothetical protein
VPFDGFLAGFDDGFEPQWLPMPAFARVGFTHTELADGEAQEIEADLPLEGGQGMRDACFLGAEVQSHLC